MDNKTKRGNTMIIVIVVVVAVAIIGYLIYDNNQKKQAESDAQVQQAQQQQMAAEKQAADTEKAAMEQQAKTEQAVTDAQAEVAAVQAEAQETATVNAAATCEEELETATKLLPGLEDYSDLLENIGEEIDDNPDKAVEKCREIYEDRGLSKNECQIKVDDYVKGKTAVYDELQAEIKTTEATIAAGC